MFLQGNIMFVVGPFIGWIRDATQSYEITFHCLTVAMAMCAVPWLLEICCANTRRSSQKVTDAGERKWPNKKKQRLRLNRWHILHPFAMCMIFTFLFTVEWFFQFYFHSLNYKIKSHSIGCSHIRSLLIYSVRSKCQATSNFEFYSFHTLHSRMTLAICVCVCVDAIGDISE